MIASRTVGVLTKVAIVGAAASSWINAPPQAPPQLGRDGIAGFVVQDVRPRLVGQPLRVVAVDFGVGGADVAREGVGIQVALDGISTRNCPTRAFDRAANATRVTCVFERSFLTSADHSTLRVTLSWV